MFLRMELFGWIGRQQFEETWMALLSVLNSTPSESTPPAELPFINLVNLTLFGYGWRLDFNAIESVFIGRFIKAYS